ncbi:MAG: hypothetical protein V1933_08710 [Candidatus Omnitrophota bacterium]
MNQDSKEDNIPYLDYSANRWTYFDLNLLGDPALSIRLSNAPILIADYKIVNSNGEELAPRTGETMEVLTTIKAFNKDVSNVTVTLSSSDPYLTIEQSSSTWYLGNMLKGESRDNSGAPFKFKLSMDCPSGYVANAALTITESSGYNKSMDILIKRPFFTISKNKSLLMIIYLRLAILN